MRESPVESMNSGSEAPLVSIGVPVFNEEDFIDSALASLRQLAYPNLEIIISDNASTDHTVKICERHAAMDPRIRIERATDNRGAVANFQHTLDAANGRYFMWAGGHDLWSSNLISECVALLESNKSACLAFGSSEWIGREGQSLAKRCGWADTRGLAPTARFFTILWGNMHPVMGLIRTEQLRSCGRLPNLVGGDLLLLSKLALRGEFAHAKAATWFRRETRVERNFDVKVRRYVSEEVGISTTQLEKLFPLIKLPIKLAGAVAKSQLPFGEKLAVLTALIPSLLARYIVGRRKSSGT